jgi:hypothetical protein
MPAPAICATGRRKDRFTPPSPGARAHSVGRNRLSRTIDSERRRCPAGVAHRPAVRRAALQGAPGGTLPDGWTPRAGAPLRPCRSSGCEHDSRWAPAAGQAASAAFRPVPSGRARLAWSSGNTPRAGTILRSRQRRALHRFSVRRSTPPPRAVRSRPVTDRRVVYPVSAHRTVSRRAAVPRGRPADSGFVSDRDA